MSFLKMDNDLIFKPRFFLPDPYNTLIPGVLLCAIIAALSVHTGAKITYITPLLVSMGIGILLRNAFIIPKTYDPGIFFSMKPVLRFAVALLGIRITVNEIVALSWQGILIALLPLVATIVATIYVGKLLKISQHSSLLIATGTGICGASAIMTIGTVTKAKEEDIIVSISSIAVFGTISMIVYPLLFNANLLPFTNIQYGYWAGASIHEVAQVVTAAFAGGNGAGEAGILVKLTRVIALIPFALIISYLVRKNIIKSEKSDKDNPVIFPFFLVGFIGMVILNSIEFFTPKAVKWTETFDVFLFTMAMAAIGLETDFRYLLKIGLKPFFLSVFATMCITIISFILIIKLL